MITFYFCSENKRKSKKARLKTKKGKEDGDETQEDEGGKDLKAEEEMNVVDLSMSTIDETGGSSSPRLGSPCLPEIEAVYEEDAVMQVFS